MEREPIILDKRINIGFGVPLLDPLRPGEDPASHRDMWLALRRKGIGASEVATIMGVHPYSSLFSLWWQKREGWDFGQTQSMEWGTRLEAPVAEKFAEEHPELDVMIPAALYVHAQHDVMLCSPDRLAISEETGEIVPVEIKTDEGGEDWGMPGTDQVPLHHRMQVQWQIAIFDSPRGHLVRYGGKRYSEYVIPPAPEIELALWRARAEDFLLSVRHNRPPDVDGSKATTAALETLYPDANEKEPPAWIPDDLVQQYQRLDDLRKDTETELAEVKNRIRKLLKGAKYGVDRQGNIVVSRTVYTRRSYVVKEGKVDRLNRSKGDTE